MLSAKSIDFLTFAENKMPQFKELKSKGIVEFGEKNAFPEQLIYLINKSATHNSIVQQKVLYIIGEGVKGVPQEKIDQWNKYDTFQEFRYKITHDVKVFGGFAVEVVYNRAGVPSYYHIDVSKIRTLDHSQYFYAEDWSKAKEADITNYPAYNPNLAKPMTKQLYYYREYRAGLDVYPLPEYYPALNYIDIDARISNFHQNNIASGFSAGHILQLFKGEPTPEEARLFKRKLKEYHQGDSNAGSVMLVYNEKNEPAAELTPLMSSGLDTMFIELSKAVESNIFIAHQVVSPMLLGVKEEGQLGGRNELAVASELFYRQYVKPNQQRLDSIYTQFLNDMGVAGNVETLRFEPVEMDYETLFEKGIVDRNEVRVKMGLPEETAPTNNEALINAINGLSPLVANKVLNELSINEIRGLVGLSPVIGGEGKSQISEFSDKNPFADEDEQLKVYAGFGEEENYFEFADLTEKELKVIEVVNENPKASLKEISEVTKIAEEDIDKILQVLDQKGKIKYTSKAVKILDADILKQTLVVRYKYDLRADAPKLIAGGESRDFCKKLISLGRVYSREDIDKMSTVLGYDVWKRRGGWYHNPNTDVNEPACRHEWKQIIVRRKNA
jgi:predicted transcriptional regulator